MTEPVTLLATPLGDSARNYAFLRREGIRHLERMAGGQWTDFNAHDPGITILEQLCYAVTDLAYRIDYELPDLLAEAGGDPARDLYGPAEILPSSPVTSTDLRKLVLDVPGVRNAWIEKVEEPRFPLHYDPGKQELSLKPDPPASQPVRLKGLCRVLVEKSDLRDIDGSVLQLEVARRLHAHRNLCEDFEEIRVLQPMMVKIAADVEIDPVEDAQGVLKGIFDRVSRYISPSVHFQSLRAMVATGKALDEIFDGPLLSQGFLDSDALDRLERRTVIHTSDVIHEIMSVPGVRAARKVGLAVGDRTEAWSLDVGADLSPKFDVHNSAITLRRGSLTVDVDVGAVIAAHFAQRTLGPPGGDEQRSAFAGARDRKVGNYHSIQHQFPALYGVGSLGLPTSASRRRKAQAKQLKAYLMFFDQLLANYFSQLAHVKDLFSFGNEVQSGYFSQVIEDPTLGLNEIRRRKEPADRQAALQEITDRSAADAQRADRFLTHLLARFAEQFTDYSLVLYGAMREDAPSSSKKLMGDKRAFLRHYPAISRDRGTAFNYLKRRSPDNMSGLEKRIALKLGLAEQDEERFYLVEHILLRPMEGDQMQQVPMLADPRHPDPYSLQLSFVLPDWPKRFQRASRFRPFITQTIRDETPAHLYAHVLWLDREAMAKFERTYRDWLEKRRHYWSAEELGVQSGA